jgi:hypothetical protein
VRAAQLDFQVRLEEVQARDVLPEVPCELNFTERLLCAAKFYDRENCEHSLNKLRETIPGALDSVFAGVHQSVLSPLYCESCLHTVMGLLWK